MAVLHLGVAYSVISQPLFVHKNPEAGSIIWPLHNDTVHRRGPGADFFAVYHAGGNLAKGTDPYHRIDAQQKTPYWFGYRYLPIVGQTLGVLASRFEPLFAWRAWCVLLECLLFGLIARLATLRPDKGGAVIAALLLISSPYFLELHMGQFTFATSALIFFFATLPASRMGRGAQAVLFSAAAALKLFPLAAGAWLIKRKERWVVGLLAAAIVAGSALAFFVPNEALWGVFWRANISDPGGGLDAGNYGTLYGLRLVGEGLGVVWTADLWKSVSGLWRLFVLGVSATVVVFGRRDNGPLAVGMLMCAHFVSYVQVWEHHHSAVIVCTALALLGLQKEERFAKWALLAGLLLLAIPTPFAWVDTAKDHLVTFPGKTWSLGERLLVSGPKSLVLMVVWAAMIRAQLKDGFAWPWSSHHESTPSG